MRNLLIMGLLIFGLSSCGGDTCQECTGTNSSGEMADFTVCDNDDGTTTRTNNTTNETTTDSLGYLESIVFLESLGLDCASN